MLDCFGWFGAFKPLKIQGPSGYQGCTTAEKMLLKGFKYVNIRIIPTSLAFKYIANIFQAFKNQRKATPRPLLLRNMPLQEVLVRCLKVLAKDTWQLLEFLGKNQGERKNKLMEVGSSYAISGLAYDRYRRKQMEGKKAGLAT